MRKKEAAIMGQQGSLRKTIVGGSEHTLLMNRPNMPPRPKPMTPLIAVLAGHDSIADCIYA